MKVDAGGRRVASAWKRAALPAGPAMGIVVAAILQACGLEPDQAMVAGVTIWCGIWWVFEPVPVPATSLIPLALLPILGVLDHKQAAAAYGDSLVLLLMAGFMLSRAMESSGAHRQVALAVVRGVGAMGGGGGRSVVFGFMVAAAALSMWISNTATTLMLLPVAIAVLEGAGDRRLTIPLLLGLAYAANIGGIGTPIGTPPNIIFMGAFDKLGARDTSFGFLEWMMIGIPVVAIFVPLAGLWMTRGISRGERIPLPEVGPWTSEQLRVLGMFLVAALLWVFQKYPAGGWTAGLGWLTGGAIDATRSGSATVAAMVVVFLFALPNGTGGRLLTWNSARTIPWGVLILFGGGIALASAFVQTGLSATIAGSLTALVAIPIILVIAIICLLTTFLTEVTSNTAMTTLLMPILGSVALGVGMDPAILMVPAAMSASCAFMLPVATAPNAVVYGTETIPIQRMVREGLVLNIVGVVVITLIAWLLVGSVSEPESGPVPDSSPAQGVTWSGPDFEETFRIHRVDSCESAPRLPTS
ncbi:MAG: SLC13 family permease [Phycisphaerales bacterium]|nr:SLC13 family permease [Phycisphaerales bacterium]